ncbi:MAG: enoyl-CoA hydratase/isomerase family protein [Proteobacteria bacterium]|nr:enoyl-CoA hydratase/isomerase family protein [Pseudomonadota bacterium]
MSEVEVKIHPTWAEVILNRPERKNAITGPLGIELAQAFCDLETQKEVAVILLRGADGAFCSGLDLKAFNTEPPPDWMLQFPTIWRDVHRSLFKCSKTLVVALERFAINGGAALALAADILVVGEEAFLQVGEVQQGMAAPYNMAWLTLRHSPAVAAQVALIGRRLNGAELKRLGIAWQVVADEQVLNQSIELCEALAAYPSGALMRIKAGLRAHQPNDADAWFDAIVKADPLPKRASPQKVAS